MEYTKYAAVGHFKCHRTLDGKKYPVVYFITVKHIFNKRRYSAAVIIFFDIFIIKII